MMYKFKIGTTGACLSMGRKRKSSLYREKRDASLNEHRLQKESKHCGEKGDIS